MKTIIHDFSFMKGLPNHIKVFLAAFLFAIILFLVNGMLRDFEGYIYCLLAIFTGCLAVPVCNRGDWARYIITSILLVNLFIMIAESLYLHMLNDARQHHLITTAIPLPFVILHFTELVTDIVVIILLFRKPVNKWVKAKPIVDAQAT